MNKIYKIALIAVGVLLVAVVGWICWVKSQVTTTKPINVVAIPAENINEIKSFNIPATKDVGEFALGEKYPYSSIQGDNILNDAGKFSGHYNWGSGTPSIYVTTIIKKDIPPPADCEYACRNTVVAELNYYLLINNDFEKIYTEEIGVSNTKTISYIPLSRDWSEATTSKISFIQSINDRFCCDDGGNVLNRVFEVDFANKKTVVREISSLK